MRAGREEVTVTRCVFAVRAGRTVLLSDSDHLKTVAAMLAWCEQGREERKQAEASSSKREKAPGKTVKDRRGESSTGRGGGRTQL